MEGFIDIPGYEGLYAINKNGEVWSYGRYIEYEKMGVKRMDYKKGKILKNRIMKTGYAHVSMYKDGKCYCGLIHRLLSIVFLPNPDCKGYINHKNGVRHDNRLENLEWCTQSENVIHCVEKLGKQLGRPKKILQIDLNGNILKEYKSTLDVQRKLGFKNQNISLCALGKCKHSYGFIWKYIE